MFGKINPLTGQVEPVGPQANVGVPGQAVFQPWQGNGTPLGVPPGGGGDPLTDSEIMPSPMMMVNPQAMMQGLGQDRMGAPGQSSGIGFDQLPFERLGSGVFGVQAGARGRAEDAMARLQAGVTGGSTPGSGGMGLPPTGPVGMIVKAFMEGARGGELSRQLSIENRDRRAMSEEDRAANRVMPNRPGGAGDPYRDPRFGGFR